MTRPLTETELSELVEASGATVRDVKTYTVRRHGVSIPYLHWVLVRDLPPPTAGLVVCPNCVEHSSARDGQHWSCALCGATCRIDGPAGRELVYATTPNPPGCDEEAAAAFRLAGIDVAVEISVRRPEPA